VTSGVRRVLAVAAVVVATSTLYAVTFNLRSITDTDLNSLQTRALVLHGDVDLSRYHLSPAAYWHERNGGRYSIYGVGVSVVSAPAYVFLARTTASERILQATSVIPFAVLALLAMWRLLIRLVPREVATAGTVVFGFGTTLWPLASMALYQHASVAFFHVLGIRGFLDDRRRGAVLAGAGFGAAAFVRLPAGLPIVAVGLYYLIRDRRSVFPFAMGAAAPLLGLAIQNKWIWGTWLTGGYSVAGIGFHGSVRHGVWGLLFSWWRGVFAYSPVLLMGVIGFAVAVARRRSTLETRLVVLGTSAAATVAMYGRWTTWHGGLNQFGYRYLMDIVPVLVVLGAYAAWRLPRLRSVAFAAGVLSVITMTFGAAPNRFSWDGRFFVTRFVDASIGQAWIAAIDRPIQSVLRLAGVAMVGVVIWRASLVPGSQRPEDDPSILLA
jgi:hypothetical protein